MRWMPMLLIACCFTVPTMRATVGRGAEGDPLERTRALLEFGPQATLNFPDGPAVMDRETRVLTLPASDKEFITSIDAVGDLRTFRRGKRITVKAQVTAGDSVGVAVCFMDEAGMEFATGNLPLKPGANALTSDVPQRITGHRWGNAGDGTIRGAVRVTRFLVIRWPHPAETKVRLDGVDVTETHSRSDAVAVAIKPDDPLPSVAPGSGDAHLLLTSGHDAPVTLDWALTITDTQGQQHREQRRITLPARGVLQAPVAARHTARPGIVQLHWTLSDAGGQSSGEQRLAVMTWAGPDARFRDHFMFGCGGPDHQRRNALILQQLGMDILRISDNWTYASQAPGVHDWENEPGIKEAKLLRELGMEANWLTSYGPTWGLMPDTKPGWQGWQNARPPTPEAWRAYMQQLAMHTKGLASTYEIWNEADWGYFFSGTADHYLDMLKTAHEEIRKVNPDAKIISSGMAGDVGNFEMQRRVAEEGKAYFDYYGWHQHGNFFEHFQPSVEGRVAQFTRLAGKPVFYTETSEQSHGNWEGEMRQAGELIKKVVHAWGRGARGYQWFILFDNNETWGLIRRDDQPKPSLLAYNTLIATLRGLRPQRALALGTDRWAWVFADASGARQVVVHWKENQRQPEADYRLEVGERASVVVRDLFGHDTAEPIFAGQVRIQPRSTPVFVVIDKAPVLNAALPLAVPESAPGVAAGAPFEIAAVVGNPGDRERTVALTAVLPDELQLPAQTPTVLSLNKNAQARHAAAVTLPTHAKLPLGSFTGTLAYDLPGAWSGRLTIPLESVRLFPAGPITPREPDFLLAARDDVVNPYHHDPIAQSNHWQGPADLSAKVWLACHDDALVLRVEVSDDRHHNPHANGDDSWKGDGIQIAFDAPGRQGYWEAGLWLHSGQGKAHLFRNLEGLPDPTQKIRVQAAPRDGGVTYDIAFPLADFGLTAATLHDIGFRLNLIVNDDDGSGRRQYLRIAPGIGDTKTMAHTPLLRLR